MVLKFEVNYGDFKSWLLIILEATFYRKYYDFAPFSNDWEQSLANSQYLELIT